MGFLIVQKLRNLYYRQTLIEGVLPISKKVVGQEKANDPIFQRNAYETIFENNELYDRICRPLLWSKWAIVKANKPMFILPDTASILGNINGSSVLFAPLTPTDCFVTSGLPENEKRALPHILNNGELANMLTQCLRASCNREFVSHPDFQLSEQNNSDIMLGDTLEKVKKLILDLE